MEKENPTPSLIEFTRKVYDLLHKTPWQEADDKCNIKSIKLPAELKLPSPEYTFFAQYILHGMIAAYRGYSMIVTYTLDFENNTASIKCPKKLADKYDTDQPMDNDGRSFTTEQSFAALADNLERGHAAFTQTEIKKQRWHISDGELAICPIDSHSSYEQSLFYLNNYFTKFNDLAQTMLGRDLLKLNFERSFNKLIQKERDQLDNVTIKIKDVPIFARILGVEPEKIIANAKANIIEPERKK